MRGDSMRWVCTAIAHQENLVSPLASAGKLEELSPCTEFMANKSLKRLLHFPARAREMKKEDAERCLRAACGHLATVETRAAKRALDAAATAQAEDARRMAKGAAVAGKRAASARKPMKS